MSCGMIPAYGLFGEITSSVVISGNDLEILDKGRQIENRKPAVEVNGYNIWFFLHIWEFQCRKEADDLFDQDYMIRLIKEMVRTILKLLFNIGIESPSVDLLEESEEKAALEALLFYSYLNDKSDEFLEEHNFSRNEIKQELTDLSSRYGLDSISEIFLQ